MSNNLLILLFYLAFFLLLRFVFKRHIEHKYNYVIPMKKGFGVDRNVTYYDEEVINNKKLAKEINNLFFAENIGVAIMFIGVMYSVLT